MPSSSASTSISSAASTSIGSTPGAMWSSARSIASSMNSQATSPGTSSTMRSAQAPHCSSCGKPATTTARRSGIGSRRTSAEVTIASVPSLPVTSARRSTASVSSSQAIVPSPNTTSMPSTWSAVTPWPRQCSPPALVPMLPPITEAAREDGSGVKRRPWSRASRSSCGVREAGLHERGALLDVEVEDRLHAVERDHEAAARGHGRARQRGAPAARDDGHAVLARDAHGRGDVLARLGIDQRLRLPDHVRGVARHGGELGRPACARDRRAPRAALSPRPPSCGDHALDGRGRSAG